MKKYLVTFLSFAFLVLGPLVVQAQGGNNNVTVTSGQTSTCANLEIESLQTLFALGTCILIKSLWPLLLTMAVIVFIVGVIKYISGADDSTKRTEGRNFIIYGLVGLFVLVSVWGLVGIIQGTFGLGSLPIIPQLQEN